MSKKLGGILIVLGLLVAIPYCVYIFNFSGKSVGTYQLVEGSGYAVEKNIAGVTVSKQQKSDVKRNPKIGPIQLAPEMNPLRVKLKVDYLPKKVRMQSKYTLHYRLSLKDEAGTQLWSETGEKRSGSDRKGMKKKSKKPMAVGVQASKTDYLTFDTLSVEQAGEWFLHSDLRMKYGSLVNASLEIRRNVAQLNMLVVAAGGVLFILGFALMFISGKKE